ncbi:MAG: hypothetical protein AAFY65_14170 [Pseudomonadota bacterium]
MPLKSPVLLAVAALALAACSQPPAQPLSPVGYVPLDHDLPFAARTLLPRAVTLADVRENNGCYAYLFEGLLYPIRRPDGGQYCVG